MAVGTDRKEQPDTACKYPNLRNSLSNAWFTKILKIFSEGEVVEEVVEGMLGSLTMMQLEERWAKYYAKADHLMALCKQYHSKQIKLFEDTAAHPADDKESDDEEIKLSDYPAFNRTLSSSPSSTEEGKLPRHLAEAHKKFVGRTRLGRLEMRWNRLNFRFAVLSQYEFNPLLTEQRRILADALLFGL